MPHGPILLRACTFSCVRRGRSKRCQDPPEIAPKNPEGLPIPAREAPSRETPPYLERVDVDWRRFKVLGPASSCTPPPYNSPAFTHAGIFEVFQIEFLGCRFDRLFHYKADGRGRGTRGVQECPRCPQEAPGGAREARKSCQDPPKSSPGGPRGLKIFSQSSPRVPKSCPRARQTHQDEPNSRPRPTQNA